MARPRPAGAVVPTWRLAFVSLPLPRFVSAQLYSALPPLSLPHGARQQSFVCLSHFTRCAGDLAHSDSLLLLTRRRHRPTNCHATAQLNAITPASPAETHTDCSSTSPAAQTQPPAAASKHPPPTAPVFPAHTSTVTSLHCQPIGLLRSTHTDAARPCTHKTWHRGTTTSPQGSTRILKREHGLQTEEQHAPPKAESRGPTGIAIPTGSPTGTESAEPTAQTHTTVRFRPSDACWTRRRPLLRGRRGQQACLCEILRQLAFGSHAEIRLR